MEMQLQKDEEVRAFVQKEEDSTGSGSSLRPAQRFGRRTLAVAVGLAVAGAATLALVFSPAASTSSPASTSLARSAVDLYEATAGEDAGADPCTHLPFLHLDEVMQNNLGKRGPDYGKEEGLWFKGKDSVTHKEIVLKVSAKSRYYPNSNKQNGFNGKYGTVNLKGGKSVDLVFKVFDKDMNPLTLPKVEFTFFDLDTGPGGDNTEFVEVEPYFETALMSKTELQEESIGKGHSKFTASTVGDGSDNPEDPALLTNQQKNRAVTVTFKDFTEMKVKLGSSYGKTPRYFTFVARPSLLCAKTAGKVDAENEIVTHDDAGKTEDGKQVTGKGSTGDTGTDTASKPTCCLIAPLSIYCVETAPIWMFWC